MPRKDTKEVKRAKQRAWRAAENSEVTHPAHRMMLLKTLLKGAGATKKEGPPPPVKI